MQSTVSTSPSGQSARIRPTIAPSLQRFVETQWAALSVRQMRHDHRLPSPDQQFHREYPQPGSVAIEGSDWHYSGEAPRLKKRTVHNHGVFTLGADRAIESVQKSEISGLGKDRKRAAQKIQKKSPPDRQANGLNPPEARRTAWGSQAQSGESPSTGCGHRFSFLDSRSDAARSAQALKRAPRAD